VRWSQTALWKSMAMGAVSESCSLVTVDATESAGDASHGVNDERGGVTDLSGMSSTPVRPSPSLHRHRPTTAAPS